MVRRHKEAIIRFLFIASAIVLVLFLYLKFQEKKGIYFPQKGLEIFPSAIGLPYEEVDFITKDNIRINGWFIPHPGARYTFLFFHGNAGNIANRLEKIKILQAVGVNIFIIDYRGYGKSQGSPQESGFYKDAEASYKYLRERYNIAPPEIILYGESLGTAVAIELATKEKVGGLILEGAFSCGRDMAKRIYPFLPRFIFTDSYDSLSRIKRIKEPKLFLHSRQDEIVPIILAQKLFGAAVNPKYFVELKGGHNNLFWDSADKYLSAIEDFIKLKLRA
ncbi:MAG: alpha/beta hydrolase [Candidatus Omnitrophota bacterium]